MKIASWNVNGIRAVHTKGLFVEFLQQYKPDILGIQETKAEKEQLSSDLLSAEGYTSYFHSCRRKKGYSGVAIYTKIEPLSVFREIGVEKFDEEGRVIGMEFPGFTFINVYFPNGGSGQERLMYKLEFYDAFFTYCENLRQQGKKLIICGDYNTAHYEIDLARPKENIHTSGFMDIERVKLDKLVNLGYIDTFRMFNQEPNNYTWWDVKTRSRERNIGWRIDYHWATNDLVPMITKAEILQSVLGSDHCPVTLELHSSS
ncbi:MAG: exodeoxyribonuclease III [Ignavibacteria bacterium]|jgi:exodeoxyribonuclease-3|nr:exodeoxyribonuclease III [Ignavibacteria bacterium]